MQPGYRPYPQQMPPQRSPHGLAPNARRVGPAPPMMAPGIPMAPMPMTPHHPMHHGVAPMTPQQHMQMTQQQQQQQPQLPPQQQQQPPPPHHGGMPMNMHQPMGVAPMGVAPMVGVAPQQAHLGAPMVGVGHHLPPHASVHHQQQAAVIAQQQQQAAAAAAAAAAQQQAAHHASEAAKRRSRKPTDKTIPDGVEDVVVGDGVQRYRELRDFERRLDATMTRKRLDIVDSMHRSMPKRFKTLRIWISNTAENQLWQGGNGANVDSFDYSTKAEASYRVKIEGRLLDDGDEDEDESNGVDGANKKDKTAAVDGDAMETDGPAKDAAAAEQPTRKEPRYRFTHFFRAMTVDFDTRKPVAAPGAATAPTASTAPTAPNGNGSAAAAPNGAPKTVEWKRPELPRPANPGAPPPAPPPEHDELTFKRPGDENVNITINLFRYEEPERFELDDALAEIVDMKEATRAEAVMGLFEYIRLLRLQEDEEKRNFRCDDQLRRLINNDIGYIPMLHEYVNAHIRPLPPVQLPYTIRVDEAFHRGQPAGGGIPTVYDVRVAVDDPLRAQLRPFVASPAYIHLLRDVAGLDEQLAVLVQAVGMSKSKHEFLTALARDPAGFVRQWLSSQKRDLEVIMGESLRGGAGSDVFTGSGTAGAGAGAAAAAATAISGNASDAASVVSGDAWRRGGADSIWASQNARESVNLLLAKQPLIPRGP